MTATIKGMRPTEYKHIVALIALYRPGPLNAGIVTSYINRMNGREEVKHNDPRLCCGRSTEGGIAFTPYPPARLPYDVDPVALR